MTEAEQAQREVAVRNFRDRLLAGLLVAPEDLLIHHRLKELAEFLDGKHARLKNAVAARLALADDADADGYVPLDAGEEEGLELYWASDWADNPPPWFRDWIARHPVYGFAFDILKKELESYEHKKMSKACYDWLIARAVTPGLVGDDGTIFGFAQYEQLDERWMTALLNYVLNIVHPGDIFPFPKPAVTVARMTAREGGGEPVLGIVGDWGGGAYLEQGAGGRVKSPAQRVLDALKQHQMDYLFHLGDTYYAGTDGTSRLGPNSANEEQDNLIDLWPDQGPGRNYTLNSNHEMYGAAQGYFAVALDQSGLFDAQQGQSLFALKYPLAKVARRAWLVLGLDSAYFSDDENGHKMYMDGAIGSKNLFDYHQQQMTAVTELCRLHSGPIMVMTHHNPCDTITARTNVLYDQVVAAIGRAPTLWLWGHVHNCIVYDQMTGAAGPSITKSRCCGHGAVPFGPAWGLNALNPPYVARTHDDAFPAGNPRVYNGYALVTLHDDGGFTESYYEVRLPGQPGHLAWSKRWSGRELQTGEGAAG